MDRSQSLKIIENTFENKFDRSVFIKFIIELLNLKSEAVKDSGVYFNLNSVPNNYKPYIESFEKVTSYHQNSSILDIVIIRLQKHTSIERARTMQRNFIAWYLKGGCDGDVKDAALAAFVSPDEYDWRFSLIRMDFSVTEDKKGAAKLIEQFSPAKRWSFLVGSNEKSHTAQAQLIDIVSRDDENIKISELEDAFSVEKVTKEFFTKYRELFFQTKDALDEIVDKDIKVKSDFESKNISTVDFAKKLLGQIVFLYFLQKKGWFGVARDSEWGTGPKNFLSELFKGKHKKYKNFFNDILEPLFYEALRIDRSGNDDYYNEFNCKIPFLNGGLFDPISDYDWIKTEINLPNKLFSNSELTNEGDTGTGILDTFDRYNFTVQEDEPLEKEVAVDPEMLGKVFENLLEVKDRKSKGTYYTPREIVHYMCQQSIIYYLSTELENKVKKEDIESLIKYGGNGGNVGEDVDSIEKLKLDIPATISENATLIDKKLVDIKICDPAVGSGAFLVGIMIEIVRTRNILSKYLEEPYRSIYGLKRDCIENSLYGVDIDHGAIEICKLRLWLSLIVDEDDIRNIKPLPNLDYKIVCGNSLLSLDKQDMFIDYNLSKIEELKLKYFGETDVKQKKEYKNQIEELTKEITNGHKEFDFEVCFSEVFHRKNGFDIVIANPPYIRIHKQEQDLNIKNLIKKVYISAYKDFDYYVLFMEKGLNILKDLGILSFITPDKYLVREYGKGIRSLIFKNSIIELFDISRAIDVFDAAIYPLISLIKKYEDSDNIRIKIAKTIKNLNKNYKEIIISKKTCLETDRIEIIDPIYNNLIDKIFSHSLTLKDILQKNQLFCGTPRAKDYHSWANYIKSGEKVKDSLRVLVCSNLQPFIINSKKKVRTVGLTLISPYFYNKNKIISDRRWNDYAFIPKILIRGNDTRITAVLDEEGSVFIGIYGIKIYGEVVEEYKYLLASLNSKLYQWIFSIQNPSVKIGGGFFSINAPQLLKLPFRKIDNYNREKINSYIDKILNITKHKDYFENTLKQEEVKKYKEQIDHMIYDFYGLTPGEIEIIENLSIKQDSKGN